MSEGSGGVSSTPLLGNASGSTNATIAEVDDSPLQKTMDKNKESLKVKLMMRRPLNQLVAQGIIPSLKTPPAFHEQRQKLERAKAGDLLKAKIQQRPDREELVRQHILEADMGHVDPSLAERQRMLKKARLADSLNDQLSHRPGPLELIKKNILHTEEPIERAVKEGVIPFKATSEGQLRKPQHPDHYVTFEDDSQSSEGAASPPSAGFATNSLPTLDNITSSVAKPKEPRTRDVLETAAASAGIVNVAVTIPTNAVVVTSPILQQIPTDKNQTLQTFAELCSSVVSPLSLGSSTSSLSPLSSIASPPTPLTPRPAPMSSPAPGKADKNRKKSKTKTQPKTRTIKFHEYKGPPNAQKSTPVSASSTETSYELLLQQQQLFLQWQLEWQHKYPQIILPAAQKPSENMSSISSIGNQSANSGTTFFVAPSSRSTTPAVQPATPQSKPPSSPPQQTSESQTSSHSQTPSHPSTNALPSVQAIRILTKLEDMKVSDLKMELKKRNLPVSGPKPQLIERLKSFTQGTQPTTTDTPSAGRTTSVSSGDSTAMDLEIVASPANQTEEDEQHFSPGGKSVNCSPPPESPLPTPMDTSEPSPPVSPNHGDNIIQQQQRKIEELQKELQKSQQQLQQIRRGKDSLTLVKSSGNQTITSPIPVKALIQNGIIHIDPKSQQKLILQQHLQNKIQQQQLQLQLQQQQQQQQQSAQPSETVNAKASLAAFINQQQAQQQLNMIQATISNNSNNAPRNNNNSNINNNNGNNNNNENNDNNNSSSSNSSSSGGSSNNNSNSSTDNDDCNNNDNDNNNNNNNSGNNNSNSNKINNRKSMGLAQERAALVLNHLNLVKQKNGLLGHQRANSLPSILSNIVQNAASPEEKQSSRNSIVQKPKLQSPNDNGRRAGSEEQTASKQAPPEYVEATQRKGEKERKSKNVKSQIVDDVLEILIKNGELPPSAANDPATPTPGREDGFDPEKGLIYPSGFTTAKTGNQPPPQFNLPNTTFSSSSSFSPSTFAYLSERNPQSTSNVTFSIDNSRFSSGDNDEKVKNGFSGIGGYMDNPELMSTETSDFNISNCNDQNFHSNSLDYILSSNDNLLSSELSSNDNILPSEYGNGDINLKELGLDLETLDSMDFSQLDCKMDGSDAEMTTANISTAATTTKTDQLINNNPELIKAELIEPMEMDDNWLDSLIPSAGGHSIGGSNGGFEFLQCSDSPYDSILGNTQDPFGLFDMHDSDFKLPSSSLSWDKVDFAT